MVTLKLMVIQMTVLLSKLIVRNNHQPDGYSEVDGNPDDSFTIKVDRFTIKI
jgi:hypothetical protein